MSARTVLLVEDDKQLQKLYAEALTSAGFTVLAEHDGEWALRSFQNRTVDAVVLDALLPGGKTGFQIAEELRKMPRGAELPILLVSGVYNASRSLPELKLRIGDVEMLEKPIEPSKLVDAVFRRLGMERPGEEVEARSRLERARAQAHLSKLPLSDLAEARSVDEDSQVRFRGAMLVRGNLRDTPFAEVLAQLHRWRATGALLLKRGDVKKLVYMREGSPNYVRSNLLNETLGHVLVHERMITVEECDASVKRMAESKRQQGTALIEMACISPANLAFALQLQLEQKLFDLFTWPEGDYQFNPRADPPAAQVAIEMTLARILFEGVRRHYEEDRLRRALGKDVERCTVKLAEDPLDRFQEMGLEGSEALLYGRIDGFGTVQELIEESGLAPVDALKLLYALRCAGMIAFGPPRTPTIPPPPPMEDSTPSGPQPRPRPGIAELPVQRTQKGRPPPVEALPERAVTEGELAVRQLVERLAARAQDMRRGTLFEVLGVDRAAPVDEVRRAFTSLAKENHPDRLGPDVTREARAFAEDIFAQLLNAYEVLVDPQRRAEYERTVAEGIHVSDSDEVARILAAEQCFREGEELMKRRASVAAQRAFAEAVRLYPEEAEFHAWLGWATWTAQPPGRVASSQALAHIEKALELNPRIDRAYVFRGYIHKAQGRRAEAEAEFEKALLCNPGCAEALEELRLHR